MLKNRESSLHRSLKFQYSGSGGDTEILEGSYVCDARTAGGELIEVQIGSLGPLKEKVKTLCGKNKVRIIHQIIVKKHIELYDTDGRLLYRRLSPRKGCSWDLFKALIYAPEFPRQRNLTIELVHIDVVEKRINDGTGSWRRKGVSIGDRILEAWHHSMLLRSRKDYGQFIPFSKKEEFTVRDLGKKAGITPGLAKKTLYVLAKLDLVERIGKKGNAFVYQKR